MWSKIASFILRNRVLIVSVISIATLFFGYHAQYVEMTYKFGGLLPKDDSTFIEYEKFINEFSEDGNVVVLGIDSEKITTLETFNAWYDLAADLRSIKGEKTSTINSINTSQTVSAIDSVFSIANLYSLNKDTTNKKFTLSPLLNHRLKTQEELDHLFKEVHNLPFYEGLLYKKESNVTLMMVFVNAELFNSKDRGSSVEKIKNKVEAFHTKTGIYVNISGLPFIRTEMTKKVKSELRLFIGLTILLTAILLLVFFKNINVVLVSLLVVAIGVIWSLGIISLLHYPITMLMGLIPPLIIVIGVPNCIYLINKYHAEYKRHGKRALAITRVVQKIGVATLMTNATTALGFATFIFTESDILKQFGVVAAINVFGVFFVSILLIPIILSVMKEPKRKHVRHLDRKWIAVGVSKLIYIIQNHRIWVYAFAMLIIGLSIVGVSKMKTTGNIVGDLPGYDRVVQDLKWFEKEIGGVMPFEILIDTKRKNQVTKLRNLKKIDKLQTLLKEYPEFSKSLSIADVLKFARQGFYGGNPEKYGLLKKSEQSFIAPYFKGDYNTGSIQKSFMDSTKRKTRVSSQIADIGTAEMAVLMDDLKPKIDSIFNPKKYDVTITGTSVVFLKGTNYMVNNLLISLLIAIGVIAFVMAMLFKSVRMVLISLIPNTLPLLFTAGIMGWFGISLKPSTILVFSIAFGISVDDTIHFLAKYRQELKVLRWNIKGSVIEAVKETGVSMMYTSVVLFFGFGIFGFSEFDGTRALGILVAVTLLVAMFANLVLLPSLLLSLDRRVTTQAFKEPFLEIIDEEEDIEIGELMVKNDKS